MVLSIYVAVKRFTEDDTYIVLKLHESKHITHR